MAPYLATLGIGEWEMRRYRRNGIAFHDAVDPALLRHVRPRSGRNMLVSQKATSAYRRLARVIAVPARGGNLSFWLNRDLEPGWDWFFVEARPVGSRRWTTLPDQRGHTRRETAPACPGVLGLHPFLARYQTDRGDGTCTASGSTGEWHAATGRGRGYQKWSIDLDRYAGRRVLVSLSYVTDDVFDFPGAYVDDVTGPRGRGTTSFERDGDRWDGWELRQPPKGSPTTDRSWAIGDRHRQPPTFGEIALGSLRRQPEILRFLSRRFGPYPFGQSGAIVDDARLGFALETQTRPVYASDFFTDRVNGDAVVVHELAHQWYGDSLTVRRWRHIWLNEGFATYAEWLWSAREGRETPRQLFEGYYAGIPADSPFWDVTIGDPGPDALLDVAVYYRGAMTLQVLRNRIGNDDFFRLLRRWARQNRHDVVTTSRFVAMAEQISGRQLDRLFERWLFTPGRPAVPGLPGATVDSEPPPLLGRLLR
ncbi:M1 family aminopeptidase [Nocardioides caldifontis]|uniref:M1 family aminopeptidase n=1 Tax=Nocardioides caldifontis TaxID=2588938 RepID=UPI0011E02800|nr:M1 family aminopeptidase [Nocardioides caldifontis]